MLLGGRALPSHKMVPLRPEGAGNGDALCFLCVFKTGKRSSSRKRWKWQGLSRWVEDRRSRVCPRPHEAWMLGREAVERLLLKR